jgi:tetratricopeptide (TPR) repeat protein
LVASKEEIAMIKSVLLAACLTLSTPLAIAQSFAKAEMFLDNGLTGEAQKELIEVVFAPNNSPDKPRALNLLASIAVDKNNLKAALDAWNRLIKTYPTSPEAVAAKARLPLLASVLGQVSDEVISDASARVYLRNGDFWAKDRDRIFKIDASWIPNVEAAVFWYDKVIADQPGTPAARTAYEEKMRTLLGWKDSGQYGESHGIRASPATYIPVMETTFREYEKNFPTAGAVQAFRFQVAQAYWRQKNWSKTRDWLNEVIEKDGGANSFYKDLAERRLKKVEY